VSERFVAKFSWLRPVVLQLAREIGVLTALVRVPRVPLLPGVVASTTRPPLVRVGDATLACGPTETLRRPLSGQQAAALQRRSIALTRLPGHGALFRSGD
jgi:hypothetical protein